MQRAHQLADDVHMTTYNSEDCAAQGAAEDIIRLLSIYTQLNSDAKGSAFCTLANALAEQRVCGLKAPDGTSANAYEWLTALAKETYPKIDIAAELFAFAADVDPGWDSHVFSDGWLAPLLCPAAGAFTQAKSMYWGYMSVRDHNNAELHMPDPIDFFGLNVSKNSFRELTAKGWVFDEVEWKNEVQDQCTEKLASFVVYWRRLFFEALLSGQTAKVNS